MSKMLYVYYGDYILHYRVFTYNIKNKEYFFINIYKL